MERNCWSPGPWDLLEHHQLSSLCWLVLFSTSYSWVAECECSQRSAALPASGVARVLEWPRHGSLLVVLVFISLITDKVEQLSINFCVKYLFIVLPFFPLHDYYICLLLLPKILPHKPPQTQHLKTIHTYLHSNRSLGVLWLGRSRLGLPGWFIIGSRLGVLDRAAGCESGSGLLYPCSFWGPLWGSRG